MSDPHDKNRRLAADFCRDLGREDFAEAVSRSADRIADLERQLADVKAQLAERTRENDAIRELMNTYNLGGWTDAVEPMKRALAAEQRERELREALAELLAADYAIKGDIVSDDYYAMALRWSRAKDAARAALAPAQKEGE